CCSVRLSSTSCKRPHGVSQGELRIFFRSAAGAVDRTVEEHVFVFIDGGFDELAGFRGCCGHGESKDGGGGGCSRRRGVARRNRCRLGNTGGLLWKRHGRAGDKPGKSHEAGLEEQTFHRRTLRYAARNAEKDADGSLKLACRAARAELFERTVVRQS